MRGRTDVKEKPDKSLKERLKGYSMALIFMVLLFGSATVLMKLIYKYTGFTNPAKTGTVGPAMPFIQIASLIAVLVCLYLIISIYAGGRK